MKKSLIAVPPVLHIGSVRIVDDQFIQNASRVPSCVFIICSDSKHGECLQAAVGMRRCLILHFHDTADPHDPGAFSPKDAKQIQAFLSQLPDGTEDLYIFCDAGESRSAAIAAALLKASGKSDAPVWDNPYYHPNMLVFRELCAAFSLVMPRFAVRARMRRNKRSLHNTINGKKQNRYTRWEPLR